MVYRLSSDDGRPQTSSRAPQARIAEISGRALWQPRVQRQLRTRAGREIGARRVSDSVNY
jgi:hypothetical protein